MQAAVAAAFQEALGLGSAVDVDASFFEIGGDSALAVRVIGKLRETVTDQVSLRDLFESPTVAGLSARLAQRGGGAMRSQLGSNTEAPRTPQDRRNRTLARLRDESPMSFRTGDSGRSRPAMSGPSTDFDEPKPEMQP